MLMPLPKSNYDDDGIRHGNTVVADRKAQMRVAIANKVSNIRHATGLTIR